MRASAHAAAACCCRARASRLLLGTASFCPPFSSPTLSGHSPASTRRAPALPGPYPRSATHDPTRLSLRLPCCAAVPFHAPQTEQGADCLLASTHVPFPPCEHTPRPAKTSCCFPCSPPRPAAAAMLAGMATGCSLQSARRLCRRTPERRRSDSHRLILTHDAATETRGAQGLGLSTQHFCSTSKALRSGRSGHSCPLVIQALRVRWLPGCGPSLRPAT